MKYDQLINSVLNEAEIGLKSYKSPETIAKKHKCDLDHVLKQLEMGNKVEKEHTTDPSIAKTIASHHVYEDKDYYTKLKKVHVEMVSAGVVGGSGYAAETGGTGTTYEINYAPDNMTTPKSLFKAKKKKSSKGKTLPTPDQPLIMRRSIYLGM